MFITYMGLLGHQMQIQSLETDFSLFAILTSGEKRKHKLLFSQTVVEYLIFIFIWVGYNISCR